MIKSLILVATTFRLAESAPGDTHVISIDKDFSKVNANTELSNHVAEIVQRLKTFKVPIHPRIRLFYLLLKKGMENFADMTADTIFVPNKYNVFDTKGNEIPKE